MINKNILFLAAANMVALFATAKTNFPDAVPADTSRVIDIEEVVVVASPKENFKLREQPSSVTLFSRENMERFGIKSIKNLTSYARNLFIPDYGSRMTSAIYIRGIGSRINTPAVGLYLDNMPVIDKSSFDFFMLDIDRVDVLNGPQATLYGRNSMGGLYHTALRFAPLTNHIPHFMVQNALNAWGAEREMPHFASRTFDDLYNDEVKQKKDPQ